MYNLGPFIMDGVTIHSNQGSTFSNYRFYCLMRCHTLPSPTYQLSHFTSLYAHSHL